MTHSTPPTIDPDQQTDALRYAHLLDLGTRLGVLTLVASFATYVLGLLQPHVPLEQLPAVWSLPVADYLRQTGTPTGWGWVALAYKGDLSGLLGISVLSGCSLPPLLGLIPAYVKRGDFIYAAICTLIVVVLVLAASGVLTGGH